MNEQRKELSKKVIGWIIFALILTACIIGRIIKSQPPKKGLAQSSVIYCESDIIIDGTGTAIIPPTLTGSESIVLKDGILNAVPTPNREHIIVLDSNKHLYLTDFHQSAGKIISKKTNSILAVREEGILYRDSKGRFCRYLFADDSTLPLGKCKDYQISKEGFTISYADNHGKVYTLTADSAEKEKIGTYRHTVDIITVSNDGNTVVYGSNVMKKEEVMLYENGTLTNICELLGLNNTLSSARVKLYETEKGTSMAIIPCLVTESKVYIKHPGQDIIEVNTGIYPSSKSCYTSEGLFVGSFFTDSLIWIHPETGESHQILPALKDYVVNGSQITYLFKNGDLYCAEIHEGTLSDKKLVDKDVSYFQATPSGQHVYYYRNGDEKEKYFDLYVATVSEPTGTSVKVDSEVFFNYDFDLSFSTDEQTVYYYTKGEEYLRDTIDTVVGTTYNYENCSILKRYTLVDREAFQIDASTIPGSLSGGRADGFIENSSFIYQRRAPGGSGYTWQYFDGTGSSAISSQTTFNIADIFEENPYIPPWRYPAEP